MVSDSTGNTADRRLYGQLLVRKAPVYATVQTIQCRSSSCRRPSHHFHAHMLEYKVVVLIEGVFGCKSNKKHSRGVFDVLLDEVQVGNGFAAVDEAVVVGQADVHHLFMI